MKHILVVDDEPPIRLLVEKILQSGGYRVSTAPNGMAAIQAVRQEPPDLVVCDLSMPGVDGFAVCGMLKRTKDFKSPVIVLSARTHERDIALAMKTGVDAFLSKPVNREELLAKVAELLAKADASPES